MRTLKANRSKAYKYVATALGAIVLGALGSGLWQDILRPVLRLVSFWMLDIVSFSYRNFKDGVYRQIGAGAPTASLQTFGLLTSLLVVGVLFLTSDLFRRVKGVRKKASLLRQQTDGYTRAVHEPESGAEVATPDLQIIGSMVKRLSLYMYLYTAFVAFGLTFYLVVLARTVYVDSAISYYHQLSVIARPYLDEGTRAEIDSRFAQVRNREQYVHVIDLLADTAKQHGQFVPNADIW